MKTLLLTGGTGFLGSHIIEELSEKYHFIVLKRTHSNTSKIDSFSSRVDFIDVDTTDLAHLFSSRHIDIIIHTATQYGRDYHNLSEIIESNVYLPMRLLDMGLRYHADAFINTDTFWDENMDLPIGLKYYALTKKDFLKYAHLAIKEHDTMKFINLKIEHLYGPRDDKKKFLPYIISTLVAGADKIPLTFGEQKRDFIYVKDAVSAYGTILENIERLKARTVEYDIGTGEVYSIRHIVEQIQSMIGTSTVLDFGALDYRKGEVMEAKADISGISSFGWKPSCSLERGLQETIVSMQH